MTAGGEAGRTENADWLMDAALVMACRASLGVRVAMAIIAVTEDVRVAHSADTNHRMAPAAVSALDILQAFTSSRENEVTAVIDVLRRCGRALVFLSAEQDAISPRGSSAAWERLSDLCRAEVAEHGAMRSALTAVTPRFTEIDAACEKGSLQLSAAHRRAARSLAECAEVDRLLERIAAPGRAPGKQPWKGNDRCRSL